MKLLNKNIVFAIVFLCLMSILAFSSNLIEKEAGLIFSHKLHAIDNGMACEDCHSSVISSKDMKGEFNVKEEKCLECHEKNDDNCVMCHKDPKNPNFKLEKSDFAVVFNHEFHNGQKVACVKCHGDIAQSTNLNRRFNPEMSSCMDCHELTENIDDCYVCHKANQDLKPENHDQMWAKNHGVFHSSNAENCKTCHTENYCIECHQGDNLFAESHPPDFILTHSMSFLSKEKNCFTCHQDRNFCVECHTEVNFVKPISHNISNWKTSHFRIEGKVNIEYCTVCHTEADPGCIQCHSGWKK